MSQAIQLQVTQVGLEQSIAAAMKRVGSSSQINLGTNSRQINALSQPLGRITGQADEFSKSMEAANARVLAFGASAGIIAGVSKAMAGLVSSTIKVEKSLVEIGSVLNKTGADLDKFGQDIFNVAKNTGQSFDEVAKGALELSRQGLNAEDTLARLNDALILSRLSGLDATQSVEGLTAAFNSFQKSGITTAEILNKVVAVSQKYAVSERDIIEGLKRSAAVADLAGVSFEELAALITAVQQKTARGGAVIGNAFKTIFSRLQDKAVLSDLQDMGIAVTDLQGNVLPALKILEGLAGQMDKISQIEQADIAKKLGGVYQLDKLLAALKDLSSEASVTQGALEQMGKAGDSAYKKNAVLNETLSALINKVAVSAEQLGAKLGDIGVTDSLKNILGFFNNLLEGIQNILGEESGLGNLVRGLVKGLGSFLAGPGLALFGGIILKLSKDLVQFGFASLKAFFGIGKAAKDVQNVEGAISQILAKNVGLQQQLFALEGNRAAQLRLITGALVEQEALLRRSASISSGLAAPLYNVGARATSSGLRVGNSAGGYMPTVAKESKAIKQGVGGARSGDKPVVMPNFNFGGGKKGTMVAHTGEYVVPNFNGSGGSAVFNRRMVQSMGLPSGAKKIGAAGGFVPNFAEESPSGFGPKTFLDQFDLDGSENSQQVVDKINSKGYFAKVDGAAIQVYQDQGKKLKVAGLPNGINIKSDLNTKLLAAKNSYNANAKPNSAVMLIPQNQAFDAAGANTDFKKENQTRYGYKGFRGGVAGVDKNISNIDKRNLSEISNIDNLIGGALSVAAISVLEKIQPGLKVDDVSSFSVENIKKTLEAGGAGAFGSIKGALFESIIGKVAKAKGRKFEGQGSLDIDFDAGGKDSRRTLETIFGLTANQFDFADFKNSIGQKDSYINQVISYLPKNKNLSKQANAAGGYIPNFSKYIYDSDRLNPDKGATLAAVLSSKAKKNLLIGPAGSGKSTFAGKSGQFLSGIDDVPKATEIDILSGAARAKGGLSKSLESIIAAVNSSGGKVSYLYTKNLEILSRRRSRTSPSEGDLRSIKQLKGTRYAPLNQFDFLSNVKSKSKNFNLIQGAAGGYIPNFVGKSREVGRGVQGAFYKLGNQKDGTQVGVKKFFKDGPSRAVEFEWLVAEYLSKHTKIPAVFGPKNLSTLQDSVRKQSIRKELVSDPLAKNALGSQVSEMFGRGVLFNALQAQGLSIGDLHGSNYTVNANAEKAINELGNFPQNATGAFSTLRDMASKGSRIGILDTGAAKVSEPARTAIGNILKMASQSKASAAGGFIPNFNASALEKERRGRGVNRFSSIPVDLSKTEEESIPDKIFRGVRFNRKKRKDFLNKGLVGTKLTSKEIFNKKTLLGKAFNPMRSDGGGLQPATTDIRVAAAFAAGRKEIQSTDQVQAFADKLEISPLSSPSLIQKLGDLIYQRGNTESEERKSAIENSIKSISGFNKESLLGGIYEKAVDPNNFIKSSTISKYSKPDVADSLIKQIRTGSNLGKEPQLADLRGGKIPAEKEIRVLGGFGKVDRGYLVTAKSEEQLRQQAERKELDKLEMIKRLGNVYKDEDSPQNSIGANYQTEVFKSQAGGFMHTLVLRQKEMYLKDIYSKSLKDKEDLIKHIVEVAKARNLPLMPAFDLDKGDKSMLKLLNKSGIKPAPVSKKKSAAGGFVPNFAGEAPNRGIKSTAIKIAQNLAKGYFKYFIDDQLGDGTMDHIEKTGILNLRPQDTIPFIAELKKPTKSKHRKAFEKALLGDPAMQAKFPQYYQQILTEIEKYKRDNAAGGFLPNFANPLKDAVGREMAAGVPASQIYIDKSPSLKNAGNPMGLMVANRRDEPSGGFQGINRARREGANPMMYGAAGGFVPNYAPQLASKVESSLGGRFGSDVKTAINDFAKKASVAGSDMDALSAILKQTLKTLGNSEQVSKRVTEESKKLQQEINKNYIASQESRASKILESESNKKLAKQLDKVYLEYNKSQKTKENLRKAEDKAAAILQKTQLGTISQRAVVGSTASLAGSRKNAQVGNSRDMLGTIFAIQGAMSALTGATDGATSRVGLFSNALASSLGGITTASFAFQGLKNLAPEGSKTAAALGKIGGAAIAAYAGFEAMKLLYKSIKIFNGDVERGILAVAGFSDALNKFSLTKYSQPKTEVEKVSRQLETKNIIKEAEYDFYKSKGFNQTGASLDKLSGDQLSSDKDVEAMVSTIRDIRLLSNQEIKDLVSNLKESTGNNIEKVKVELAKTAQNQILLSNAIIPKAEDYIKNNPENKNGNDEQFLAQFNDKALKNAATNYLNYIRQANDERKKAQIEQEKEAVDQIKISLAQDRLKNALANSIAAARSFESDALGQQLLTAKELGNLDEKSLRNVEDKIALREIDRKLEDETLSVIQSQIDKAKAITASAPAAAALQTKLGNLTPDDLRNQETVKAILAEANSLLAQGADLTKAQRDEIEEKLNQLFKVNKLEKKSLESNLELTGQYKDQVKQLDLISQASKRAQEAQSFNRGIATTRSINANDLRTARLESSKLGSSESQVRQIDQQIAAIKANTVALEQQKEKESIFDNLKNQLLEANKSLMPENKREYNNRINAATEKSQLEAIASTVFATGADLPEQNEQNLAKFIDNMNKLFETFDVSSSAAIVAAEEQRKAAGAIAPVISALALFERSLLDSSQIIDQKIEDIKLQQLTSVSGRELLQGNYDIETLNQQKGQTAEEAARIARKRQVKSVSQLFGEEFGKTEEERVMDINKAIVDGSVQFKNNMIEGIMGAVEGTSSLKDGLRSAAYEFIKSINQKMMSNLVDKVVGGNVESGTGQTGGGIVGFLSNMFASGGKVTGGSGSKDDVPAMLMGGEYVVNKKAVSKYGAQFMESINSGTLSGYAKGGKVQSGPQGNFYTPGTFGQGSIEGKRNLLDFATQSGTSGQFDQMTNSAGYQSISLEPESSRLSVSGMRNSPMFDATQSAKGQAFDLYLQQYNSEREAKKQEKEQKKALTKQLIMLVASTALGGIGKAAMTGGSNAVKALGENAKFLDKAGAFFGGMYKGGDIGDGIMGGGLKNLFSGNFGLAYQSDILKASPVSDVAKGYTGTGPAAQGSGAFRATSYGLASIDKTTAMDQQKADAGNPLYKGFSQTIGASGRKLRAGYSVASNFYPLGTILNIGGKEYQVDDTGGMSKNVIDFFAGGDKNLYKQFASLGNINPQVVSKKAIGGMISSTSGIDTVPAMLSGGEFVMNRSAVQGIGASNLQSMNSGGTSITSEETSKELNEKLLAKLDELINSSGSAGNITINVAPSGQTTQDNSQDPSAGRQQLARQIKDAVLQIINDEKRIGGSLRR